MNRQSFQAPGRDALHSGFPAHLLAVYHGGLEVNGDQENVREWFASLEPPEKAGMKPRRGCFLAVNNPLLTSPVVFRL